MPQAALGVLQPRIVELGRSRTEVSMPQAALGVLQLVDDEMCWYRSEEFQCRKRH